MKERRKGVLFLVILLAYINCSYGCSVEGTIGGSIFISPNPFRDVDRGTIIDTGTTNILGIQSISYGGDLIGGPYVDISFVNNRVLFVTNNNYENYEEIETTSTISADVIFTCAPGSPQSTLTVTFRIDVQDTNNNAPQYIPSNEIAFTISTPVPPNFDVTGCGNEIVVRDIDLTTTAVHFTVNHPDFEIENVISTTPKEFKAVLRTTTLIRSISEPIVFTITATDQDNTGDPPLTTVATVNITGNMDFTMPDELVFSKTFYHHNYDANSNVIVPTDPIHLQSGYDNKVRFFLHGELSDYFILDTDENTAIVRLDTALPDDVLSKQFIFFEVRAEREDTAGASATVIIQLPSARELMFEESSYRGSIQNNDIALGNIRLPVGYEENIEFELKGEFANYFTLNDEKNSEVTLHVDSTIPENVILENNLIYLTVTASGVHAITTTTSILLDIIKDDISTPVFSRNIYYGTYLGDTLDIPNINLIQGFDGNVSFKLDGEHSQYFEMSEGDNNGEFSLLSQNIPADVIFNEKVLVFNVIAEKPLTVGANAAVVIRFSPDLTDTAVMKFSQNTYIGKYENNELHMDNVILSSGYASGTEFILTGEFATYFKPSETENTVSLELVTALPTDTIEDSFIVLEIEARRKRAASVWTSVVIDIVNHEIVPPVFTKTYYTGVYNADTGLQFDEVISLLSGFDETVTFGLEGELSSLFELVPSSSSNSFKIETKATLSAEILTEHSHLLFTVFAVKPGASTAHSALVIDVEKEHQEASALGFERVSYVGSVQNNEVNIIPIRLIEGYTDNVVFALYGALSEYFRVQNDGPVVNLELPVPIPDDRIPESGTIVLDIRATLPEIGTAFATIVLTVVTEVDDNPVVHLQFDATYYTGSYGASGLSVNTPIVLSEGFGDGVHFNLEGDDSQWFSVVPTHNSVALIVETGIPEAVLLSNQRLVFAIVAQRPGSIAARATIVISLTDEHQEASALGFERVSYVGSVQNNEVNIIPIRLIEGYTDDVVFALYGALSEYFRVQNDGPVVNLELPVPIPDDRIPESGTIVLDLRATLPEIGTAFATIVLDVVTEVDDNPVVHLQFDATYYTGSYGASGLSVNTPIVLSEGFGDGVHFNLEGDDSQWFNVVPTHNSVALIVETGIPEAVLLSNQQLVFAIVAQRPGSIAARATIVISLTDEHQEASALGFERVSYVGSVQNNEVNIIPIRLIEGYTDDVVFALYGALSEYFRVQNDGPVVNLELPVPIPDDRIPESGTIVLDIRATLPEIGTAFATIVLDVVTEVDDNPVVHLQFDATYYTGSYGASGLTVNTPIVLSEGFGDGVYFNLEGDDSQWFNVVPTHNSVALIVETGIPEAVLLSNQQLVFAIVAQRPGSIAARATIVISLTDEHQEASALGFERVSYVGSVQNNEVNIIPIRLIEGYTDDVVFALYGALSEYFRVQNDGPVVNLELPVPIPDDRIPESGTIVLDIRATFPEIGTAFATIVLDVVTEVDDNPVVHLQFDATYYTGSYGASGLSVNTPIVLSEGFGDGVHFNLEGDDSQWFNVEPTHNSVALIVETSIPEAVLLSNQQLVFAIVAQRPGSIAARATIVISLTDEHQEASALGFERVSYVGSVQNNEVNIIPIRLIEGYTDDVVFALYGALSEYFRVQNDGPVVNLELPVPIPDDRIPESGTVVLDIRATLPEIGTAFATIVLDVVTEVDDNPVVHLQFDATYYTGSYGASGLTVNTPIVLSEGFGDGVYFNLEGDDSQWFNVVPTHNSVALIVETGIPEAVLLSNQQLVFAIVAQRPGSIAARATIVISLTDEHQEASALGFERVSYVGSVQNNEVNIIPIRLIEGYTDDVVFALYGALSEYFRVQNDGPVVNLELPVPIPDDRIPESGTIVLDIRATLPEIGTAFATIVLTVVTEVDDNPVVHLQFDATYYTGSYGASGLSVNTPIVLSEGFGDGVHFNLEGDDSQWFNVVPTHNSVALIVETGIPEAVLLSNQQLVFAIVAQRPGSIAARATIVISVSDDLQPGENLSFEKLLYRGSIDQNEVSHEDIIIPGFDGTTVLIIGDYSHLFIATAVDGVVTVTARESVNLPADVTQTELELRASTARAVLLLNIKSTDPELPGQPPIVTFTSDSYAVTVNIEQTGIVGRVLATTDNEEAVTYSLANINAHLQSRLSINNEGELFLSAPANSGVYTFQVIATTVITAATGTATVHLRVQAVTICGGDIVIPPLITLDRDEEEPHTDLVLHEPEHVGCHYVLTSLFPADQNWLYVDQNGLHARRIDREHTSIAFMALSQVQVELILHCESDQDVRTKRSVRPDWLGPYDYGSKNWILTDSIPYNSRRSIVNLIVNDINDNDPIFVGKEHEPITVGYPIDELEERILPRSLVELKATDADIGLNAELRYWSSESVLAVAPTTGFVHVQSPARLYNNQILTVHATDRRGNGNTGSMQLVVKLLTANNIAVVTVRNAFLDEEANILKQLSEAVGYDIKALRSVVISEDTESSRQSEHPGASLQLYVYGIINREPVTVDRLTENINSNSEIVNVISTVSLEDHLEDSEIQRDIGLLVATIVLSILLFILILLIAVWYFLRWRKNKNYDQFSDKNSIVSRNESLGDLSKPAESQPASQPVGLQPRLNIDDLKKSERRLQEMLNAPIEEVTVEPVPSKAESVPLEAILDISMPEINVPIVIQSIDKLKDSEDSDDEFGEINKTPRKSVVTFNENVEKIIHVEDDTDSQSGYEIYKF